MYFTLFEPFICCAHHCYILSKKSALGLVWFPDGVKEHILHSLVGRQKKKRVFFQPSFFTFHNVLVYLSFPSTARTRYLWSYELERIGTYDMHL